MQIDEGNTIHDTAIIELGARIGKNNYIGAYTIIKSNVVIGDNNYIGDACIIGDKPEKKGCYNSDKKVLIGNNNRLTKQVTIDIGTDRHTVITDNCTLLKNVHVGHDAVILNTCTLACNVVIGGFAILNPYVNIGLNSSVHPRADIPKGSMIGCNSMYKGSSSDVFYTWVGSPAKVVKFNKLGHDRYLKEFEA